MCIFLSFFIFRKGGGSMVRMSGGRLVVLAAIVLAAIVELAMVVAWCGGWGIGLGW